MSLEITNVSKRFEDKIILNDFSYSFSDVGFYIIRGDSGIGKTTLLRIISGLDTAYSGSVNNGGPENCSFMFQEYLLFPALNALKNAAISSNDDASDRAAEELLIKLGFDKDDLKKKPRELSGGMKQRVAFVRALLKDAPILILDEPTKELDSDTADIMLDIIEEESKKRLVIVVAHDDIYNKIQNSQIIRL